MSVQTIALDKIHPNRYQTRPVDQAYVEQTLAPDIAQHGLLQAPLARPLPFSENGEVELAFGHHRLAAMRHLQRQEMAVSLVPFDDQALFEFAVVENEKRKPTTPIEKARTLKKYLAEFKVTQAEAGKLFGIEQAFVSNLLSLLDYPEPVQAMIADGRLPLRYAWMLRPIIKFFPERATNAAGVIAKTKEEDREREAHDTVRTVWRTLGVEMDRVPWAMDWVPDPAISAEMFNAAKGEPKEAPACKGCAFLQTFEKEKYCARKPCYHLKSWIHARREVERLAKKTGIPLAAPDEKVVEVFEKLNWDDRRDISKLLERKPEGLRFVPREAKPNDYYENSQYRDAYGSEYVTLAATNKTAVLKALEGTKEEAKQKATAHESEAQKAKRLEREKKEEEARRKERAIANREKWEIIWLLEHIAEECAKQMQIAGGILVECERQVHAHHSYNLLDDLKPIHERISTHLFQHNWMADHDAPASKQDLSPEAQTLRRHHIIFDMLAEDVVSYRGVTEAFDWQKARQAVQRVIGHELCLKLPDNWDRPPVLHTEFNCWHEGCGRFAPGEKITQRDIAEGWGIVYQGDKVIDVNCPDHVGVRMAAAAAAAKRPKRKAAKK